MLKQNRVLIYRGILHSLQEFSELCRDFFKSYFLMFSIQIAWKTIKFGFSSGFFQRLFRDCFVSLWQFFSGFSRVSQRLFSCFFVTFLRLCIDFLGTFQRLNKKALFKGFSEYFWGLFRKGLLAVIWNYVFQKVSFVNRISLRTSSPKIEYGKIF